MTNVVAFRNTIPADTNTKETSSNVQNTELASSSAENSVEREQITTFHDVETPNRIDTPLAQDTSAARQMDDTHSIIQFLQRPVLIDNIEIIAGTTEDSNRPLKQYVLDRTTQQPYIKTWTLPSTVLKSGGKAQKLANFKYLRCDIKVKIVLNANPFVAGRLYLAYSPYDDKVAQSRSILNTSRAGVTGYPGVEIDFQLDNSVEMVIPYASFQEAYDLISGTEDFVHLYLFAITPVLAPNNSTSKVDLSVYMWLENISLVIPTYRMNSDILPRATSRMITEYVPNPTNEQAAIVQRALRELRNVSGATYNIVMRALQGVEPEMKNVTMQINAKGGKPQTENPKIGPITELSTGVKQVANGIERIPVIGEICKPVTSCVKWFADRVAQVAAIFGWSKPRNQNQVTLVANTPGWGASLYKGIDMSVPLAFDPNNELGDLNDVFPSGVDEMAIGYVCSNPAVKHVLRWSTTDAVQNPLNAGDWGGVIPVGLPCYSKTLRSVKGSTTTSKTEIIDSAPCEYVTNLFSYWRATMCYKITVVKTAFHTGRLEIFFEPGTIPIKSTSEDVKPDTTVLNGKLAPSDNNYRYILDLTNDTEITIRVPYVSNKMFMKTTGIYGANSEDNWNFSESFTGFLCIRPVTKLMCPETVADNISVIIWKWAEDVVLVEPKPLLSGSTQVYNPPVTALDNIRPRTLEVSMQINLKTKTDQNEITFFSTGNAEHNNDLALMRGSGEQVVNLRTLLRTFRTISDNWPLQQSVKTPVTTLTDSADAEGRDYMSYLSFLYRFYRGGRRYKFYNTTPLKQSQTCVLRSFLMPRNYSADEINSDGPSHITYPVLNPVHEVEVPFYSQYRRIPIASTTDKGYDASLMLLSNSPMYNIVTRAGNDDFSYGWMIGPPQIQGKTYETAN
jgi:hypothetical protein